MNWSDKIDLLVLTTTKVNGLPVESVHVRTPIFANQLSVKGTEFYQAQAAKIKIEKVFEIWSMEYNNESYLEHEGKRYKIERTYRSKGGDFLELSCSKVTV